MTRTGTPSLAPWRDQRRVHLLTRGNVDGITSAALVLARHPDARVTFVTNAHAAHQALRRDLGSGRFFVIDLGLTPELARTLARKAESGADVALLDHHEQTLQYVPLLSRAVDRLVIPGVSAAAVTRRFVAADGLDHLVAIADLVEYCRSEETDQVEGRVGRDRLEDEARRLDFAWRLQVADDRFRLNAARRMAEGAWPSEIGEVQRRYLQILNEGRWERALERVRQRIHVDGHLAVLRLGRHRPSLLGFGSRAVAHVAHERGCRVAVMVHRRDDVASIAARALGPAEGQRLNLGRFFDAFTREHGIAGGGHPQSAGGKIPSRHLGTFMREIECFA